MLKVDANTQVRESEIYFQWKLREFRDQLDGENKEGATSCSQTQV